MWQGGGGVPAVTLIILALISAWGVIIAAVITGLATVIAAWLQSRR